MVAPAAADAIEAKAAQALIRKNHCTVCHAVDKKPRGPSFADIAKKQAAKVD
ncbi:c-type cytochrome [Polaromonas sp.]|uniref:c-type cytochrome n=1 Tax=Polaromonas sp. TaxID=1869339 RepID=UPI0034589277